MPFPRWFARHLRPRVTRAECRSGKEVDQFVREEKQETASRYKRRSCAHRASEGSLAKRNRPEMCGQRACLSAHHRERGSTIRDERRPLGARVHDGLESPFILSGIRTRMDLSFLKFWISTKAICICGPVLESAWLQTRWTAQSCAAWLIQDWKDSVSGTERSNA